MSYKEIYIAISPYGHLIKDGELIEWIEDRSPGAYRLTIKSTDVRSLDQNAYYWGVVILEAHKRITELGNDYSRETVHLFFKFKFNYTEFPDLETGAVERIPNTTTDLTPLEFFEYVERIRQWSREFLDIEIPEPSPQLKDYES